MKSSAIILLFFAILFSSLHSIAQAPYWNWAINDGGVNSDRATAITYTNDGNLLVSGFFQDTALFESTTLTAANYGMFIAKYNPNGILIWAKKAASANAGIEPQNIFENSSGNIFVTGFFGDDINGGTVSLINGDIFTSFGGRDFFTAEFNSTGNFIWSQHTGTNEDDFITSDINDDGVYIQGARFSDLISEGTLNSDTLASDFTRHIWSIKYKANGQLQFMTDLISNSSQMTPTGIVADTSNNFYLSGNYYGHPSVGFLPDTSVLSNAGGYTNIYLIKFHSDSSVIQNLWQQYIGGTGNDFSHALDLKNQQEILLTGTYANSSFFGNDSGSIVLNSVNPGNENFICNYQSNGNLVFAKNSGYSIGGAITSTQIIHDDSIIYLCGKYTGNNSPVFGDGTDTFSSLPVKNFFVAAYTDSANLHWVRGSLNSFIDGLNAITLDDSGHVYAAGYFTLYCVIDTGTTDSLYIPSAGVDDVFIGRLGYKIVIQDTVIIDTNYVQELVNVNSLFVYPNPASNYINIDLTDLISNASIEIYSLNGKIFQSQKLTRGTKKIFLNTSNLINGTYLIQIKSSGKTLKGKFTIVREE